MAIIFVLCMHTNDLFLGDYGFSKSIFSSLPPFKGGWIGVPLFFILSGFLIGGQLWKELITTKNIRFTNFILRRGFRIWPLYYFILIVVYIFSITQIYSFKSVLTNLFFLSNYFSDNGPIYGAWSLATEEQFYILAPLFLILVNRFSSGKSLSYYRKLLFFMFFIPLFARLVTWDFLLGIKTYEINTYLRYIYRPFHTNCEGLIAGMIISNFYYDDKSFFKRGIKSPWVLWTSGGLIFLLSFLSKIYFNFTGLAFGFAVLLIYILVTQGWITRILSHNLFYAISKTSFAIYLVHYHIIYNLVPVKLIKLMSFGIGDLELIAGFIYIFIVCFVISIVLHILIERPFIILREKTLKNN